MKEVLIMCQYCAYCEHCVHIPGDEGDEWYCTLDHMNIDDPYYDGCKLYKEKGGRVNEHN